MFAENKKEWNTIIVGAGQAGLATGYYLKNLQDDFIILDGAGQIGDSWRNRWDSLRLFTPNWANSLPGYPFPSAANLHAGKDEVANFLADYVKHFRLPVLTHARVTRLIKIGDAYELTSSRGTFTCKNIVVANGCYAIPSIPALAKKIHPEILQLHSSAYRRPGDLPDGDILVVGAGTSGIQVAIDVAGPKRKTYIAGNPPFKIPGFMLRYFGRQVIWMMNHIMTINTKPGRKAAAKIKKGAAAPLINTSMEEAAAAGVVHVPRVATAANGYPALEDGTVLKVGAIVWCTGFARDFSWIKIDDIKDSDGYPDAYRGVSKMHAGLYFVGMAFQYALTSAWINGVGRDADYIAGHIYRNRFVERKMLVV